MTSQRPLALQEEDRRHHRGRHQPLHMSLIRVLNEKKIYSPFLCLYGLQLYIFIGQSNKKMMPVEAIDQKPRILFTYLQTGLLNVVN